VESEGSGVFNWMLKGWMRVAERLEAGKPALVAPDSVLAKTDEFKDKENQAGRFFTDDLRLVPSGKMKSHDVYRRYRMWAARNGEFVMRDQRLTMELQRYCHDKGHKVDWGEKSHHQGWHWGLELRPLEPGEQYEHTDEDAPF
jgi:phage/plasmid-associated DNA primase